MQIIGFDQAKLTNIIVPHVRSVSIIVLGHGYFYGYQSRYVKNVNKFVARSLIALVGVIQVFKNAS